MVLDAGPAVGGQLVHFRAVAVLVLDRVLVDPGAQDPLLLGVDDDPGVQVGVGGHRHVPVGVDREPVEVGGQLVDEPALALPGGRIAGLMRIDRVGVEAAQPPLERVPDLQVHPSGDPLDVDLCPLSAVAGRVDRHRLGDGPGRILLPALGPGVKLLPALVDKRGQPAGPLEDRDLHEPVVQRPGVAVVGQGHGCVDRGLGDRRGGRIGAERRRERPRRGRRPMRGGEGSRIQKESSWIRGSDSGG